MQTLPDTLCYLNGEYTPLSRCEGLGARPRLHLRRRHLRGGAGLRRAPVPLRRAPGAPRPQPFKLRIANPATPAQWLERSRRWWALAEKTGAQDQLVYIQVTRGVALRDHVMPPDIAPTVFMMASPMKPATPTAPPRRGLRHRARLPLGARRHQTPRCWATCWRGRCRPTTARSRPSCSATATSPRPRPATWVVHGARCWARQERACAGRHPLRPDPRAVRGRASPQPAPHPRGRGAGGRRSCCSARPPGGAARHHAGRPAGRPRRAARQAGARCTRGSSGLPARQGLAIDLIPMGPCATSRPSNR